MKRDSYFPGDERVIDPLLCRKIYSKYLQGHSIDDIEHWIVIFSPWKTYFQPELIHAIIDMMNDLYL